MSPLRARIGVVMLAVLGLLVGACGASAQGDASREYDVKAAFLFHFAQFVEWPQGAFSDPGSPLTYCTFGQDPFNGALDASLSGKKVGEHPLRVIHLEGTQDFQSCHILFVGGAEKKSVSATLSGLKGKPVLTVGETEHFAADGGMIGFCLEDNKIRFEINLDAAEKARLKISSRLLSLANHVVGASAGK
ncbi:MAG TPA: YfiR family protein [Candidatus Acidoferrum sp.]|nr:YfiR family protein [Candidatus Acidoferrum sp.]